MIGKYCKRYRLENSLTLKDVIILTNSDDLKVGTLSSFEMGRSSNINHLQTYIKLSKILNTTFNFMNNLAYEVLNNGK